MAVTVTASEVMQYAVPAQVIDTYTSPSYKWFSLQDNRLDGSYHPMDASGASQIGWWGTQLSQADGSFNNPPTLTVQFDTPQVIPTLRVVGDPLLNEFPTNFTIQLYNGSTLVHTVSVTNNSAVEWKQPQATTFTNITKIVLTINKVNKPNRTVKILDFQNLFEFYRSDAIAIQRNFDKSAVGPDLVEFFEMDTLSPKVTEQKALTANISKSDTISINPNVEADLITAHLYSGDALVVAVEDKSQPTNIYTMMDADFRQVFGKVEVTYTNPLVDETVTYEASETGSGTSTAQLSDGATAPSYKWFSLHDNKLDGSYHPMPSQAKYGDKEYFVGWWGSQLSDDNGVFANPPKITVTFPERSLEELKVVGESVLNVYPVDFVIRVYDSSNNVLYTRTITNNTQVEWHETIEPFITGATKIELIINRINKPRSVAKLLEFFTAIVETYLNEEIQSIHLLEEVGYVTGKLPLGNVSSNEVDITLYNADRKFDLNNKQSKLYGFIKRNRRVRVWLGAYIGDVLEWHLQGTFWTTQWDVSQDSLMATFTARDRLELLRQTNFKGTPVFINKSLYFLFEYVLKDAGLKEDEYEIDPGLQDIIIPYAWFEKMRHRDALARLASCGIIQVYCTKEGKIRVNFQLDATPTVMMKFDDDKNVINAKFPLAVKEQVNLVEVTAQQRVVSASMELFKSEVPITVPAGQTVTQSFQFDNTPVVDITDIFINASSGIVVDSYTTYSWGAEVTFKNTSGTDGTVTQVIVQGTKLELGVSQIFTASDPKLIREDGEIKQTISHDFIQDFTYAQELASVVLETFKSSRSDVTFEARGNPALRLGDRVSYEEVDYVVTRQVLQWDGALTAPTIEAKRL